MGALFCLIQIVFRSSCHNILLVNQVIIKHLIQIQHFRLIIHKR